MGILNPKERILDTILTSEGRRQISHNSSLNAAYYSFTDMSAIYDTSTIVSGVNAISGLPFNETYRIALEASNLPQDTIVYEVDDSGKINASRPGVVDSNNVPVSVRAGTVFLVTGSQVEEVIDNDIFSSLAEGIVSSSLTAFEDQYILSSPDPLTGILTSQNFLIGPTTPQRLGNFNGFAITENGPIDVNNGGVLESNIDTLESVFFDKKMSNVPNYKFLPPILKKQTDNSESVDLGNYIDLKQDAILSYDDLKEELNSLDLKGFKQRINFVNTSVSNNLMCQLFEFDSNKIGRLDVIDFGEVRDGNEIKHVFFCGKVFNDSFGAVTYVNMFTLVFNIGPIIGSATV